MNRITLMLVALIFIYACRKEESVKPNFIGKWEAEYLVQLNGDTIFYQEGSLWPCAYAVLPFEYNSGFELTDKTSGELIWCGRKKGQFFTWSHENNAFKFDFDNEEYVISVENITNNSMQIFTHQGEKYHMRKF
ncbi:hypothetical protein [Pontibacter pamirensis]|uniref:hypothetical protein n=1 Tax=Pontibacter pamirensis TaxID=2562824 RepID=UPI00138A0B08|nr:hypothetical protein [Pontibacter pamirensis]